MFIGNNHHEVPNDKLVPWHSRVTLTCNICGKALLGYIAMREHLRNEHGKLESNEYKKLHEENYSCKICSKDIKLGYISIFKHVENIHGVKFDVYEDKYENEKQNKQKEETNAVEDKEVASSSPFHPSSSPLPPPPSPMTLSIPFQVSSSSPSPTPTQFLPISSPSFHVSHLSLLTPPPTPTPPPSYACPLSSCSFSLTKPQMKIGGAAKHLIKEHRLTAKDIGDRKIKWEKIR